MADALGAALQGPDRVFVAEPEREIVAGQGQLARWRDWRFGTLPLAVAWWASLGPLALAAAAQPDALRVSGRLVRRASDGEAARILPPRCGFVYIGSPGSATERCLLLRYGQEHPVWSLNPSDGGLARLSSTTLLMHRYRFVELAR